MGLDLFLYYVQPNKDGPTESESHYNISKDSEDSSIKTLIENSCMREVDVKKVSIDIVKELLSIEGDIYGFNVYEEYEEDLENYNPRMDILLSADGEEKKSVKYLDIEKAISVEKELKYCYTLDEIGYQRKGINDYGWTILKQIGNSVFCENKELVEDLVKNGGLSSDFIDDWVDGKTLFMAWW